MYDPCVFVFVCVRVYGRVCVGVCLCTLLIRPGICIYVYIYIYIYMCMNVYVCVHLYVMFTCLSQWECLPSVVDVSLTDMSLAVCPSPCLSLTRVTLNPSVSLSLWVTRTPRRPLDSLWTCWRHPVWPVGAIGSRASITIVCVRRCRTPSTRIPGARTHPSTSRWSCWRRRRRMAWAWISR
jgi:hypothetical protein